MTIWIIDIPIPVLSEALLSNLHTLQLTQPNQSQPSHILKVVITNLQSLQPMIHTHIQYTPHISITLTIPNHNLTRTTHHSPTTTMLQQTVRLITLQHPLNQHHHQHYNQHQRNKTNHQPLLLPSQPLLTPHHTLSKHTHFHPRRKRTLSQRHVYHSTTTQSTTLHSHSPKLKTILTTLNRLQLGQVYSSHSPHSSTLQQGRTLHTRHTT